MGSIIICWQDNNAEKLYQYIKDLRQQVGFTYSDEYIYERCLTLLEVDENKKNRFKMKQICTEAVDEYIRKMRSTGIISLRGNGRFIDFNMFEINRIDYIINNYSNPSLFCKKKSYYDYMGKIDSHILITEEQVFEISASDIRQKTLQEYAKNYTKEQIHNELNNLCKKSESKNPVLKYITAPTRLEFLTSIALVQHFPNLTVKPNYIVDDEGLPVFTASGGVADIVCQETICDGLFEVTLMRGRQDQTCNEIVPIRRHLLAHKQKKKNSFSVFIAPTVHEDTKEMANWYKHKDNIDILTFDILEFLNIIKDKSSIYQLIE